jgi:glycosyltransferase involved in cell wall biosynthesis
MYKDKKIAALVPAYNEEKLIKKTIQSMPDFVDLIIVVNDCSQDNTAVEIRSAKEKRVMLIEHHKNTGLGGAIKSAVREAKKQEVEIGVVMAGDNQMDPHYLPALLDPICEEDYDMTKANRFYSSDGYNNMPKYRVFGSIVLAFMTRVTSGYWNIMDPQNGYVAYGPKVLERLNFEKITNGYALENDILINLNILGLRIKEIPVKAVYGEEVSHMKMWKIIPQFTWFLFLGFFRRIFKKYVLRGIHPIALFFFSGTLLFMWGLGFGAIKWIESINTGVAATTGTVMLAALPLLMGFEMLLWAFVLDIQEQPK